MIFPGQISLNCIPQILALHKRLQPFIQISSIHSCDKPGNAIVNLLGRTRKRAGNARQLKCPRFGQRNAMPLVI